MRLRTLFIAAFALALQPLAGCSSRMLSPNGDASTAPAPSGPPKTGCLEGVIVDGVTNARVDIAAPDKLAAMFVLVGNQKLPAASVINAGEAGAKPDLVGEYTLCNVPLDVTLPFFVALPGYQAIQTVIEVPSTDASQGKTAETDLTAPVPTAPANVQVFQIATVPQAYNVSVTYNGGPLPGALVWLMPTGVHILEQGTDFLPPDPTGLKTLKATTDGNGLAAFAAADLALGGIYRYQVLPADAGLQKAASGYVAIGLVGAASESYGLHVALTPTDIDLVVVSSSLDNKDFSNDGSLTYYFNRPIEQVPGSLDGVTVTLDHAMKAVMATDTPGNNASEQATLTVNGQTLTLKPNFATPPDVTVEAAIGITYNNVQVRPKVSGKQLHILTLTPNVKIFGGVPAAPLPTTLVATTGDKQQGSPSQPLAQPVTVLVSDQYGAPMAAQMVTFAVTSGGGQVSKQTVPTAAAGTAATFWTLGPNGAQAMTATVGALTPLTVTATFLPPATIAILSGNNQTGVVGTTLAQALTVRVQDKNFVNVPGADVTFAVADQTNGGTLTPTGGTAAKSVKVKSDNTGQASVNWLLGSVGNTYTVTVDSGTAAQKTFSATASPLVATSLAKVSGDAGNTTSAGSQTTPLVIVALVKDQLGNPLPNVTLQFVANSTGTLSIDGGTTFGTTVTKASDGSGQVTAKWKFSAIPASPTAIVTVPGVAGAGQVTFTATVPSVPDL